MKALSPGARPVGPGGAGTGAGWRLLAGGLRRASDLLPRLPFIEKITPQITGWVS